MKDENLNKKINIALKWSSVTEFVSKLIVPITNMILARLLAPEAFGVVATVTMIISFVDMFTDAGFQKYLIQHNFESEDEKNNTINVAFWTNLIISIILWLIIIFNAERIAILVGNPGLGNVISIASVQLILTSFTSIQMSVYRREFNFKTLFLTRIIGTILPFIITIPLAILGFQYWSIIIGNIIGTIFNSIILTVKSNWRPRLFYKFSILKQMLTFSLWSLIESVSIWLTTWIDTFIIGDILDVFFLGIYKTALSTVNTIYSLITGATTPILFSGLSRVQDNEKEFNKLFFSMQKIVAYFVFPMSIGIFIFSDLIVNILLGKEWQIASYVVGIWSLISGVVIVLGHYSSEVYRAKGMPRLSFIAQILHLICLVPTCIIFSRYGFYTLVTARALIRLQLVIIHLCIMQFIIKIPVKMMLYNVKIPLLSSIIMGIFGQYLKILNKDIFSGFIGICLCVITYVCMLLFFKSSRKDILDILNKFGVLNKFKRIVLR